MLMNDKNNKNNPINGHYKHEETRVELLLNFM